MALGMALNRTGSIIEHDIQQDLPIKSLPAHELDSKPVNGEGVYCFRELSAAGHRGIPRMPFSSCALLLQTHDVGSLKLAVLAFGHVERDCRAFIQRLEAVHLNFGEMDKQVFPVRTRDEPVALLRVEPFDSALSHSEPLFFPAAARLS